MSNNGLILVLSSPSGGGKTTLRDKLRKRMPYFRYSISVTTRSPRKKEINGRDYHFVSMKVFRDRVREGKFIEWAEVHGNLYGTPKEFIEKNFAEGNDILLDIDVKGALRIKKDFPGAVLVFIAPPSSAVLEKRLKDRGTDTSDEVEKRLLRAVKEMSAAGDYDYVVVNENLEEAIKELEEIVKKRGGNKSGRLDGKTSEQS